MKSIKSGEAHLMKKIIQCFVLLMLISGCSRGLTGCAVGGVTGASVGANAAGPIIFGTLIGCTVGYNL